MAISPANFYLIERGVKILGVSFQDIHVGELGNIKIRQLNCTAKAWFKKQGSKHTSLDINGLDGAKIVDLSKPISPVFKNRFNIVTNFGTTEHIEDQEQVFKNIHEMTTLGGIMIHSIPLDGYWKGHCPYHYMFEFPKVLSKINEYNLKVHETKTRWKEKLLNFIIQKKKPEFNGIDLSYISTSKNYLKNTDNLF